MTVRFGLPCVATMGLLGSLVACTETAPEAGSLTIWDSAGVQIVLNTEPSWVEEEAWRLSSEVLFVLHASDGTDQNQLIDPASIDVDPEGRIIIADGDQAGWHAVLLYDRDGQFLKKVGRSGEGPGEFGQLWWASAYRTDSIIGFDMSRDLVAVFDKNGEFVRQVRTPPVSTEPPARGTYGFTNGIDAAFGNGDFLGYPRGTLDISGGVGPAWYKHLLLRVRPDGEAWDTLGVFEISEQYWDGTSQEPLWFAPYAASAIWQDDFYFGTGKSFEIRRYGARGQLVRVIRKPFQPVPVDSEYKDLFREWYLGFVSSSPGMNEEALERLEVQLESARYAETLPAYSSVLVDWDGNLWVGEFQWFGGNMRSPIDEPSNWSVFDTSGVWLGDVETPSGFILTEVTDDRALGFVVDEFDVKEVHVYGIEKPGM